MIFTEYFTLTALTSLFSIIIAAAVYSFFIHIAIADTDTITILPYS